MINKASQLLYIGFTTGQNNRGRRHLISVGGDGGREGEHSLACPPPPPPPFVEGVSNHWTGLDWTHKNVRNKLINHRKQTLSTPKI